MGVPEAETLMLSVDVAEVRADAITLDALARIALAGRRCGWRITLRDASRELIELIEFAGLTEALPAEPLRPRSREPRC
jgi:hypothetical protein